jgi:hypothetical protein
MNVTGVLRFEERGISFTFFIGKYQGYGNDPGAVRHPWSKCSDPERLLKSVNVLVNSPAQFGKLSMVKQMSQPQWKNEGRPAESSLERSSG